MQSLPMNQAEENMNAALVEIKTEKIKWGGHDSKLSLFPSRNANFYSTCAAQYAKDRPCMHLWLSPALLLNHI
jgi:hypothetical protein